jgi:polysaccharide biosynthesis protein PslH
MKILQVSNKIPYPEKDGGAIAINAITEGLIAIGCEVILLAMNTKKHFIKADSIPQKFRNDRHLETVEIDTSVKPINAFIALLKGESYNISRFQSEDFNKKLTGILKKDKFDIIQLEGLYLAPYLEVIRKNSKAPVIVRAHNIEWKIWQKLAIEEKNSIKKWYLSKLYKGLKKYEEAVVNKFDGIATITTQDLEYLKQIRCETPAVNIPFGIDISKYTTKETRNSNSLFYIGALDWLPNLQGLDWFLMNVWDRVQAKFPDVQFHVAGRNMPESFHRDNYPGVVFHGEVEDAKTFIEDYDIMLVPLLAGSGVRVKIIQGMAMGKPIITTNVGVEGIECKFGQDILVANTPDEFAGAIVNCFSNYEVKNSLGQNARKFAEKQYDIGNITARLVEFYRDRIAQKQ